MLPPVGSCRRRAEGSIEAAKSRVSQQLQAIWTRAKPENDFAAFAGPFADLLAITREIAAAKAEVLGTTAYGAMIDEYDPGVGEAMIDPIFADLAAFLPPLIAEVRERQADWPDPIPSRPSPVDRLYELCCRTDWR